MTPRDPRCKKARAAVCGLADPKLDTFDDVKFAVRKWCREQDVRDEELFGKRKGNYWTFPKGGRK